MSIFLANVRNVNIEGTDGEHTEVEGKPVAAKAMNAISGNGHSHKPILGSNSDVKVIGGEVSE